MSGQDDQDLELPVDFRMLPLRALRMTARRKLAGFLDLEGTVVLVNEGAMDEQDVVNDYNGLAELAGLTYQNIRNLQRSESPTMKFLDTWNDRNATVGNLWNFLVILERFDVLKDCRRVILRDCEWYQEQLEIEEAAANYDIERLQDPTVSNSEMKVDETKFATTDDVKNNKKTFYDAFVCYTDDDENDRTFVREMIKELEENRNLKLFVPGRNDLPGAAHYTVNAYLIEERCRRVVILMSKSFLKSPVCDFQVKFAHALAPGARSKKLIPVIRQKGTVIPRILRFLAVCDFTKTDMIEWVWDRLHTAIIAPVGKDTYFEPEDEYNPFSLKEITFPASRRLDDSENTDPKAALSSGTSVEPTRGTVSQSPSSSQPYNQGPGCLSSQQKMNDLGSSLESRSENTSVVPQSPKPGKNSLKSGKSSKKSTKKDNRQLESMETSGSFNYYSTESNRLATGGPIPIPISNAQRSKCQQQPMEHSYQSPGNSHVVSTTSSSADSIVIQL